jgi:hypothetical protein
MSPPENPSPPAIYMPFPSLAEWGVGEFNSEDFEHYARLLADSKESAGSQARAAAIETAQRYAAVDTNAIEGLYTVDRGFTRTVATQAAAWEAMMAARGPHVRPAFDDALNAYEYVLDAATKKVEISSAAEVSSSGAGVAVYIETGWVTGRFLARRCDRFRQLRPWTKRIRDRIRRWCGRNRPRGGLSLGILFCLADHRF